MPILRLDVPGWHPHRYAYVAAYHHPHWRARWLRSPRTTQERRRYVHDVELRREWGHKLRLRPKRSFKLLVDAWDDVPVGERGRPDRGKRHRDRATIRGT